MTTQSQDQHIPSSSASSASSAPTNTLSNHFPEPTANNPIPQHESTQPSDLESPPSPPPSTPSPQPYIPRSKIYIMVLGEAGLIFSWVLRIALTTPYFQHTLQSGTVLSHSIWILGPLSGLIVSPIIGVLSDRCTHPFGKRRPFILGGLVVSVVSMNIFANTKEIVEGLGLGGVKWVGVMVGVLSYAGMDLAANVIMFPSRALLGDLVGREQQHEVQSCAAVIASLTEIGGSLFVWGLKEPVSRIGEAYLVASFVMVVTVCVTLVVCKENVGVAEDRGFIGLERGEEEVELKSLESGEDEAELEVESGEKVNTSDTQVCEEVVNSTALPTSGNVANNDGLIYSIYDLLRSAISTFPAELCKVGAVYGLAWFCWFCCLPYFSAWMGKEVLSGDPEAPKGSPAAQAYQKGVNVFAIANVFKALTALCFSAAYPTMLRFIGKVGERVIFAGTFALFSPILYATSGTRSTTLAGLTVAISSVAFIATQTIPIAIVIQRYSQNVASNLGIFNLFCAVPQLLDTLYTGLLAEKAGETAVLKIAAAWGVAAAVAAMFLL